jgi:hypothetical protein
MIGNKFNEFHCTKISLPLRKAKFRDSSCNVIGNCHKSGAQKMSQLSQTNEMQLRERRKLHENSRFVVNSGMVLEDLCN